MSSNNDTMTAEEYKAFLKTEAIKKGEDQQKEVLASQIVTGSLQNSIFRQLIMYDRTTDHIRDRREAVLDVLEYEDPDVLLTNNDDVYLLTIIHAPIPDDLYEIRGNSEKQDLLEPFLIAELWRPGLDSVTYYTSDDINDLVTALFAARIVITRNGRGIDELYLDRFGEMTSKLEENDGQTFVHFDVEYIIWQQHNAIFDFIDLQHVNGFSDTIVTNPLNIGLDSRYSLEAQVEALRKETYAIYEKVVKKELMLPKYSLSQKHRLNTE